MPTSAHSRPTIALTSTAKVWASRSDLTCYTNEEIRKAHTTLLHNEQALKPFYSPERTAYHKLSAEMARRNLTPAG